MGTKLETKLETKLKVEAGYCACEGCASIVKRAVRTISKRKGTEVTSVDVDLKNRIITLVGTNIDKVGLIQILEKKKRASKIIVESEKKHITKLPPSSPRHEVQESIGMMHIPYLQPPRSQLAMSFAHSPSIESMPQLAHQPGYAPQPPYEYSPYGFNYYAPPPRDYYQTHHPDHLYGQNHHHSGNDLAPRDYRATEYYQQPMNCGATEYQQPKDYRVTGYQQPKDSIATGYQQFTDYGVTGYQQLMDYGATGYQQHYRDNPEHQSYDTRPIYPHDYDGSCYVM